MRMLLIEDDRGLVYFVEKALAKQGHDVISVNNGQFAAKICKEHVFDLVVLEADLAREDGFEVCRMMRRQQISTPVLMMIQDNLPGSLARIVEVGANDHLLKPFTADDMNRKIRKSLIFRTRIPLPRPVHARLEGATI